LLNKLLHLCFYPFSFDIAFFETEKTEISELVGLVFEVNSIDDSLEREDMFYVWEHEPFEN